MPPLTRREFGGLTAALAAAANHLDAAATGIGTALHDSMTRRRIPAVAAMVGTGEKTVWEGAFGAQPDSIFSIASMTKAITTTAAMQLLEQGKVKLETPAGKYLPILDKLDVLEGFDNQGKPVLRTATKPVTLHNLLTHTSGFAYDMWDENMLRYNNLNRGKPRTSPVLIFEPGTRWQYGTGIDWVGRIVEAVSGLTLEQYFQRNILEPLDMKDTSFILAPEKFNRLVNSYQRQPDGSLKQNAQRQPAPPKTYNGGGGLYSTCPDYVKFMQMILRHGQGPHKEQILQAKTVAMMSSNQIGNLAAGRLKTTGPAITLDVDLHPGFTDKWGYGFLINPDPYPSGRSAGSLAWAGIDNTFYWIDPRRSLCAVVMMQFLPFVDHEAVGLLNDFEKAVYTGV